MLKKKTDLAIVTRSFWPIYPVIGEALLRFAENLSGSYSVAVILQDHIGVRKELNEKARGKGVEFFPGKAWSTSSSRIAVRALDAIYFMLWVFLCLIRSRPKVVYVSTDPPVLVPLVVMIYAFFFKAKFVYHLQDIHPEAANVVISVHPFVYRMLKWVDALVMRRATAMITITEEMADEIVDRSRTQRPIHVIPNPAVSFDNIRYPDKRVRGFSFCGNAGRLQRIPLLLRAIKDYLDSGGSLLFVFAGGGIYAPDIQALADQYDQVCYRGLVSATEAAQISCDHEWALLPIEDEVTRFAFPSKSSSYAFAGSAVLAICGEETSVSRWVLDNKVGVVVKPDVAEIVSAFFMIENLDCISGDYSSKREVLKEELSFDSFLTRLESCFRQESLL